MICRASDDQSITKKDTCKMEYNQGFNEFLCSFLLKEIRESVVPVMKTVTNRAGTAGCWIDMKIDPIDGSERTLSSWYERDNIYGWIQGRGLETFAAYLKWMDRLSGYDLLDTRGIIQMGDALYKELHGCYLKLGHIPFVFRNIQGYPEAVESKVAHDGSICDMFVARGLLSYASYRRFSDDISVLVDKLRDLIDLSNRGEIFNDQISFHTGLPGEMSSDIFEIEGPMLAIGAAEILYGVTGERGDLLRGLDALRRIDEIHTCDIPSRGMMIVDRVDRSGVPIRSEGRLLNNPGHTLEIIGMGLQFLRSIPSCKCESEDLIFMDHWRQRCRQLADNHLEIGVSGLGTIYLSVQVEDGLPVNPVSPWWSSFEAVRTCSELLALAESDEERVRRFAQVSGFMKAIRKVYLSQSGVGIPVQTVDEQGSVISMIPATPDIDPGYHTGIPLFDAYELLSEYSGLTAGLAESPIPLKLGRMLQGHAARNKPAEAVLDPLYVRTCILETAYERSLIVSCDLIEFNRFGSNELYDVIERYCSIHRDHILLTTTHTHTGPCVMDLGTDILEEGLLDRLSRTIRKSIDDSYRQLEPVTVSISSGTVRGIGINRRVVDPVTHTSIMKPNPAGPIDESVITISLRNADHQVKGLLVNMAIHPTTLGVNIFQYSADYPGRIISKLRQQYEDAIILILQGACGDVRPAVLNIGKTGFVDGREEDIEYIGNRVSEEISRCMKEEIPACGIGGNALFMGKCTVPLPMDVPSEAEVHKIIEELHAVEEGQSGEGQDIDDFTAAHDSTLMLVKAELDWAADLLGDYAENTVAETVDAEFSILVLCNRIVIVAIPGEIFSEIGLKIRKMLTGYDVLICGYSGSSVGYIPTAEALEEGGYEVASAYRLYGYSGPFTEETESLIYKTVEVLIGKYHEISDI